MLHGMIRKEQVFVTKLNLNTSIAKLDTFKDGLWEAHQPCTWFIVSNEDYLRANEV